MLKAEEYLTSIYDLEIGLDSFFLTVGKTWVVIGLQVLNLLDMEITLNIYIYFCV